MSRNCNSSEYSILKNHLLIYEFLKFRSSFSDFAQKHGRDERFKNVEKMRERESLFNEYLLEVRKREKEEKAQKREQVRIFDIINFTNYIFQI